MDNPFNTILDRLDTIEARIANAQVTNPPAPPHIIDTRELCKILRMSAPTIIRYRQRGTIPHLVIGGSIRYNLPDVIAALQQKPKSRK